MRPSWRWRSTCGPTVRRGGCGAVVQTARLGARPRGPPGSPPSPPPAHGPLGAVALTSASLALWPSRPADLAGAQHVWGRWFHPLVSRYEPVVDRRLGESKALARDWLHSNAMRLLALAQAKALAWLAQVQAQAQQAAGRVAGGGASPGEVAAAASAGAPAEATGAAPRRSTRAAGAAKRSSRAARRAVEDSEEEFEAEEMENAVDANAGGHAGGRASGSGDKKAAAPAVPDEPLLGAFSSRFSLASFYSARSSDLQVGLRRVRGLVRVLFVKPAAVQLVATAGHAPRWTAGCPLLIHPLLPCPVPPCRPRTCVQASKASQSLLIRRTRRMSDGRLFFRAEQSPSSSLRGRPGSCCDVAAPALPSARGLHTCLLWLNQLLHKRPTVLCSNLLCARHIAWAPPCLELTS